MSSREKARPSERPNMQSANGLTNRASGRANVFWALGEGIGQPELNVSAKQLAPLPKNVFVRCYGNCSCIGGSWCHSECGSGEIEAEWGDGEQDGATEAFLSRRKWNNLCTLWLAKPWWSHSHTHTQTYTHSHSHTNCVLSLPFSDVLISFFRNVSYIKIFHHHVIHTILVRKTAQMSVKKTDFPKVMFCFLA